MRARTVIYFDAHLDLQVVNRERLHALEQCRTADGVKRLEKPHHLLPDRGFAYSLEDFLYPAHRLGLIDHLVWVAPPHVDVGFSPQILEHLQQMDGVRFEELIAFEQAPGGWFNGTLAGFAITICHYRQLADLPLPRDTLIDVDVDYFVSVPGDRAWVNPRDVFDVVAGLDVEPGLVTLSRSVGSGFMPLRYRFFADFLAALWESRDEDAAHYERLFQLERRLEAGNGQAAVDECRIELERYPDCAATHHLLSLAETRPERAAAHRSEAARCCPAYAPNVLRAACEIPNRRLAVDGVAMRAFEDQLAADDSTPEAQGLLRAALGLIYCAGGRLQEANMHYRHCEQAFGGHPELALEIGKRLLESPRAAEARGFLETALHDDKTRTSAHLCLGHLHRRQGSLDDALRHLEAAHEASPAWGQVLSALADVHEQRGDRQRARNFRDRCRQQTRALERLACDAGH